MADTHKTVDIITEVTIKGKVWTPQNRIVPADVAAEIVAQKAGFIVKPDMTQEDINASVEKTVAAHEKAAAKEKN